MHDVQSIGMSRDQRVVWIISSASPNVDCSSIELICKWDHLQLNYSETQLSCGSCPPLFLQTYALPFFFFYLRCLCFRLFVLLMWMSLLADSSWWLPATDNLTDGSSLCMLSTENYSVSVKSRHHAAHELQIQGCCWLHWDHQYVSQHGQHMPNCTTPAVLTVSMLWL